MRRKYIMQRASVLNTESANSGAPFVVASKAAVLPTAEIASFGCQHCHTVFASNKGSEPFCINCGSEDVKAVTANAQALPKSDIGLNAIECKACGAHNVMSDVTASKLDGHLHCVECGGELEYDVDDLSKPVTDADEQDVQDALNTEQADTNSAEDRGGMTDDAPITNADEDSIKDALPTTEATAAKAAPTATATDVKAGSEPENNEVPTAPAGGSNVPGTPAAPVVDPIMDTIEDETLIEHADWEQLPEDEQEDACGEYSTVSLAAVILASNPKATLTLATSDDEILAFAEGVPVARLTKADAGEFASVFHSASFTKAIASVAASKGARAALAEYKFTAIKVKFPVGAAVRAKVATRLDAQTAKVSETARSHREDLLQCVSLASTAMTKNLFRTRANALKKGFTDMLQQAGVKNPAVLVDRVFATYGNDYHRQVFELATELQAKPLDYRNTLAESMADMNTMPIADGMPNDENQEVVIEHANGDAPGIADRMENAAVRSVRTPVRASVANKPAGNITAIRAAAGGSLFSK
jgi:transcription elongation factor Elf1